MRLDFIRAFQVVYTHKLYIKACFLKYTENQNRITSAIGRLSNYSSRSPKNRKEDNNTIRGEEYRECKEQLKYALVQIRMCNKLAVKADQDYTVRIMPLNLINQQ